MGQLIFSATCFPCLRGKTWALWARALKAVRAGSYDDPRELPGTRCPVRLGRLFLYSFRMKSP
jgi:hypothetical protein